VSRGISEPPNDEACALTPRCAESGTVYESMRCSADALSVTAEHREMPERLSRSHTAPAREVRRAKALLWATEGGVERGDRPVDAGPLHRRSPNSQQLVRA
jgi:hypothetical protein